MKTPHEIINRIMGKFNAIALINKNFIQNLEKYVHRFKES